MSKFFRTSIVALVGAMTISGSTFSQDDKKPATKDDPMAALAPFVGEWTVEGKWAGGEALQGPASTNGASARKSSPPRPSS